MLTLPISRYNEMFCTVHTRNTEAWQCMFVFSLRDISISSLFAHHVFSVSEPVHCRKDLVDDSVGIYYYVNQMTLEAHSITAITATRHRVLLMVKTGRVRSDLAEDDWIFNEYQNKSSRSVPFGHFWKSFFLPVDRKAGFGGKRNTLTHTNCVFWSSASRIRLARSVSTLTKALRKKQMVTWIKCRKAEKPSNNSPAGNEVKSAE